jgi:hypothetical protein
MFGLVVGFGVYLKSYNDQIEARRKRVDLPFTYPDKADHIMVGLLYGFLAFIGIQLLFSY